MSDFRKLLNTLKRESRVKECFCASDECSSVIKAHSVQNNKILREIATDGLVVQLKPEDLDGNFIIESEEIGRKIATVSTNFCGFHDTKIFLPIESKDYRKNDKQQEFIFAYRAFAREYHLKREAKNLYENARKAAREDNKHFFDLVLKGTNNTLRQLEKEKEKLNTALKKSDFGIFGTHIIEFHGNYQIAASSLFAIKEDLQGNPINDLSDLDQELKWIFLSVFPQKSKTLVLLSFYKKNRKLFSFIRNQLMKKSLQEQKLIISNILLCHVENLVLSPRVWEKLLPEKQDAVKRIFLKTITCSENRLSNIRDINLFI
ncbi:hypothetical protein [Coleofasciculus sp. FACHB-T130]|uniref:hypothetical protein n=1 Tax=Cyanophyceae TaxID=3028117 RepID=UPI001682059B|nr:hypothetical protein [Coleofasciculus sp. FACHB-T130]MBD1880750.1 hypothetical protein [Coleofasciculus sp. FACHB-T130]